MKKKKPAASPRPKKVPQIASPKLMPAPKKAGNRDKYYTHVQPRLNTILAWRRRGLTNKEICENLGVGNSNFALYITKHQELRDALKGGKDDASAQVENAVFRTAMGYEYTETKTILEGTANPKDLDVSPEVAAEQIASGKRRIERTVKQQPPNTTAQIFYLSNRCSDRWRHKNSFEHSGPDGAPLATGVVTFYLPEKKSIPSAKGTNAA